MKSVVTGAAGFIGSHLAEKLLGAGHEVVGVDNFLDNYPRHFKENNLAAFRDHAKFTFVNEDLTADRSQSFTARRRLCVSSRRPAWRALELGQRVYPLHGEQYQRDAAAARGREGSSRSANSSTPRPHRFMAIPTICRCARTAARGRCHPTAPPSLPPSICAISTGSAFGVPTVALRFFTVYGPRQRPDMFFHIFMRALLRGDEVPLYDDGEQTRDFTFCADIVDGLFERRTMPARAKFSISAAARHVSLLARPLPLAEKESTGASRPSSSASTASAAMSAIPARS